MTEPLTPPECDLRDFPSMLLDHRRLLTSETWIEAAQTPRLGHALMSLWCESFQQVPAASLPDNDLTLLRLSMCPTPKEWAKVKARALAGWVLCTDGRLYHPVVAEKALEAWLEKLASRLSSGAGNAKRWQIAFDPAPIEHQMQAARALLSALNPQSRSLAKKRTAGVPSKPHNDPGGSPDSIPPGSQEKGSGREGKGSSSEANASGGGPPIPDAVDAKDVVFALGVPLLTAAGVAEKNARSFLAMQCKLHTDSRVADALRQCATAKALQPIPWLQDHLNGKAGRGPNRQEQAEANGRRIADEWAGQGATA